MNDKNNIDLLIEKDNWNDAYHIKMHLDSISFDKTYNITTFHFDSIEWKSYDEVFHEDEYHLVHNVYYLESEITVDLVMAINNMLENRFGEL